MVCIFWKGAENNAIRQSVNLDFINVSLMKAMYVAVQFYPWLKFYFLLFLGMAMYNHDMIISLKWKQIKFKPRIKLNHNMYMCSK